MHTAAQSRVEIFKYQVSVEIPFDITICYVWDDTRISCMESVL